MTTALRLKFGDVAAGTCNFLSLMHDEVMSPFLNVSKSKSHRKRDKSCAPFYSSSDHRLKKALLIADWLQEWSKSLEKNNKVIEINDDDEENNVVNNETELDDMVLTMHGLARENMSDDIKNNSNNIVQNNNESNAVVNDIMNEMIETMLNKSTTEIEKNKKNKK